MGAATSASAAALTTGRTRGGHSLGPPHLGTWIVKSGRHVVAAGDLDATETAGSMTSSEPPALRS